MLSSLHIRHYVLIDSLDIDFPEGLVIITGQTGAGKSILLGALSLLLGNKADASCISQGADSCVVEGEFDVEESIKTLLEENDVECADCHLVIRRVVHSGGRSRSFINDCPVNAQLLTGIATRLVDIHSQHQSLLLKDRDWQLALLDSYAGNSDLLGQCAGVWKSLQSLRRQISDLQSRVDRMSADEDYNRDCYSRLEAAGLREGELEELEDEFRSLEHVEDIKSGLGEAAQILDGEEGGVLTDLRDAARSLEKLTEFLPAAEALASRIESSRIELEDVLSEVSSSDERVQFSPERYRQVQERLSQLYSLLKRYDCRDVAELIARRDALASELGGSEDLSAALEDLRGQCSALEGRHREICEALTVRRKDACGPFCSQVQQSLRYLELERALFGVRVEESAAGARGADSVTFLFSSNGGAPEDVARCASGGEISRIMLCLKALKAKFSKMPTMIFDEIDSGVSGSAADRIGNMICTMGESMQLFSITHLPQVAAKGRAHYVVDKNEGPDGRVLSSIRAVEGEERVHEIARLLSGSVITPAALANAREFLSDNGI